MARGETYSIRVPASTANLGPGFDSIGMALGLYLELQVSLSQNWEVVALSKELKQFPSDETNYMITVARKVASAYGTKLAPCRVEVSSEIPLTRGLGSSASAIVAGIELADLVGGLNLTKEEKNRHASLFEGHPDNAGASVYGGLVIGRHSPASTELLSFPLEGLKAVAIIPDYELLTEQARNVLPLEIKYDQAVQASAVANVLVAALLTKNWELAGKMMQEDQLHEPYRSSLVPHLDSVVKIAAESGAFGTALSGAGPTVLCLVSEELAQNVVSALCDAFPKFQVIELAIDNIGSNVALKDFSIK
ncbi:homoserine kinase [Peribacillus sp. SCS-155]|uniref:homoserine kinase n=1 Tax=Peribacillus sedimenti TaxID=3115297 RepID=UPI0039064379